MSAPISGDVILAVQKSALKEVKTAIKTIAAVQSEWRGWVIFDAVSEGCGLVDLDRP
jgi:hypothetical protein